jgi:hypothetical protein
MRIVVLTAALLLVAGCSSSADEQAAQIRPLTPLPSKSSSTPSSAPKATVTSSVPSNPPASGAAIAGVTSWVEAGRPVETEGFHTATRDGVETQLGDDVAFVTTSGNSKCMTDSQNSDGALACLVNLKDEPPRPTGVEGQWIGGWVDFDGTSAQVGSLHGDPGRFTAGYGPELAYAHTLKFGDYQCRSDETGLYCVNFAHQSAVRLSDAGVETFGCLQRTDAPADVGIKFECG